MTGLRCALGHRSNPRGTGDGRGECLLLPQRSDLPLSSWLWRNACMPHTTAPALCSRPMARTIFDTPWLQRLLRPLSRRVLRLLGWQLHGELSPQAVRCVVIAAPHTSNWDFPFTLLAAFGLGMRIRWLGKAALFRPPFGWLMRWLGGIPVHRERANNLIAASVLALKDAPGPLQLVVAPEGTRSRAAQWKAGFQHIARGAGLPVQ